MPRGEKSFWVIMPPEFPYLEGLFLPDTHRARLVAKIAHAVEVWRGRGYPAQFDPGISGEPAEAQVRRLQARGVHGLAVAGTGLDRVCAEMLCQALKTQGLAGARPLLQHSEKDEIVTPLTNRVESLADMKLPLPDWGELLDSYQPCLALVEKEEPLPRIGTVFERREDRLLRRSPGPASSIPDWAETVRLISSDHMDAMSDGREDTSLFTFLVPPFEEREGRIESCLDACEAILGRVGPERFRLALAKPPLTVEGFSGGASWAARCGIQEPGMRKFLLELASHHLPGWLPRVIMMLGLYEIGADPQEEMYAGNALPDKNAELIENIVP